MNLSNFSEEPFCECIFSYSRLRIIDTFVGVVTISIAIVTGGTLDFTKQLTRSSVLVYFLATPMSLWVKPSYVSSKALYNSSQSFSFGLQSSFI